MNSTQHRLVSTYLDDLTRALADLAPPDRAEVLAGVREHIEAGLAARGGASDADVSAVLAEMGTPEEVAREAYSTGQYAERPAPLPAGPQTQPRLSDRSWVPGLVAILQVLGVLLVVTTVVVSAAVITGVQILLWIVVALLVGTSRLWTAQGILLHILLLPIVIVLMWVGVLVGQHMVAAIMVPSAIVIGSVWLIIRLTVAAQRRAATGQPLSR
ncbi:HAAS signaling domain-containing protein [Ornithinimicrobium cryptoxanthini]|uniref:HAAS signaling domain-containing protein n=1 Tax=Ornithinimicrobium cryptoxanthini TaxID=2934161 RepID=UPI00211798E4|nr:hypothetical protein [Ornithinimicrobium cryptoxanthini]